MGYTFHKARVRCMVTGKKNPYFEINRLLDLSARIILLLRTALKIITPVKVDEEIKEMQTVQWNNAPIARK